MATAIQNLVLRNTTEADFRGWGSAISGQLAAMGWVKTADTGQIDWTTVLAPTGAYQQRGYEMWRMDDALQSTAPVFLRLGYGSGATTGGAVPALWIRVGVATDGAGALVTRFTSEFNLRMQSLPTGGTPDANGAYECAFSGSSNRICVAFPLNAGSSTGGFGIFFAVERTRNASGNDTPEGIVLLTNSIAAPYSQVVPYTGPVPPPEPIHGYGSQTANSVSGTDVLLYPIYAMNGVLLNPMRSVVAYKLADVAPGTVATASIYGIQQTFRFLGDQIGYRGGSTMSGNYYGNGFLAFGHRDNGAAIRWE